MDDEVYSETILLLHCQDVSELQGIQGTISVWLFCVFFNIYCMPVEGVQSLSGFGW